MATYHLLRLIRFVLVVLLCLGNASSFFFFRSHPILRLCGEWGRWKRRRRRWWTVYGGAIRHVGHPKRRRAAHHAPSTSSRVSCLATGASLAIAPTTIPAARVVPFQQGTQQPSRRDGRKKEEAAAAGHGTLHGRKGNAGDVSGSVRAFVDPGSRRRRRRRQRQRRRSTRCRCHSRAREEEKSGSHIQLPPPQEAQP